MINAYFEDNIQTRHHALTLFHKDGYQNINKNTKSDGSFFRNYQQLIASITLINY